MRFWRNWENAPVTQGSDKPAEPPYGGTKGGVTDSPSRPQFAEFASTGLFRYLFVGNEEKPTPNFPVWDVVNHLGPARKPANFTSPRIDTLEIGDRKIQS